MYEFFTTILSLWFFTAIVGYFVLRKRDKPKAGKWKKSAVVSFSALFLTALLFGSPTPPGAETAVSPKEQERTITQDDTTSENNGEDYQENKAPKDDKKQGNLSEKKSSGTNSGSSSSAGGSSAKKSSKSSSGSSKKQTVQVYYTRTGSKYHARKCGNGTYMPCTLSSAKSWGLTPCKKCF